MKTFLIMVLSMALVAAAFFTRPGREDFRRYVVETRMPGAGNVLHSGWDDGQANNFVDGCVLKDHFLWVDLQKDGKTIYTGAFSHWFNRAQIVDKVQDHVAKVQDTLHNIEKK